MSGENQKEEQELDEFESAFAEFSGGEPEEPGEKVKDDEELEGDKEGDTALTAEEQAAADEAIQAEAAKFDGWPQAAIDAYKLAEEKASRLEHRVKSDEGRVGAFQRKINNLEHQIAQIQTKPGQPSTADITKAMGTDESWTKFSEEYPEVAAAIDGRLVGFTEQVDTVLAPVRKTQEDTKKAETYGEVAKDFPTWQDEVKKQEFSDWMDMQPPGIRALASSDDPLDASSLIGLYDNYRVAEGHPSIKSDPKPDNGGSVDKAADEVTARRQRQIEDGVTIPSRTARVDPNAESGSEFENAFAAFAARKESARNRA